MQADGFIGDATRYDSSRPGYPQLLVATLANLTPPGEPILDIGAGTGILTRQLIQLGRTVFAVEPDEGMRQEFRGDGATLVNGTAERSPLPDGCASSAFFAQSLHYCDPDQALPELKRLGVGYMHALYNLPASTGWFTSVWDGLRALTGRPTHSVGRTLSRYADVLGEPRHREAPLRHDMTIAQFRDFLLSLSQTQALPPESQRAFLKNAENRAAEVDGLVSVEYVTHAFTWVLSDR